jgi:hypothetical protein
MIFFLAYFCLRKKSFSAVFPTMIPHASVVSIKVTVCKDEKKTVDWILGIDGKKQEFGVKVHE